MAPRRKVSSEAWERRTSPRLQTLQPPPPQLKHPATSTTKPGGKLVRGHKKSEAISFSARDRDDAVNKILKQEFDASVLGMESNGNGLTGVPPLPSTLIATEHRIAAGKVSAVQIVEKQTEQMAAGNHGEIGFPHPSSSFGVTEILEMAAAEDGSSEELESTAITSVHGYKVKEELAPTLEKIMEKYGDITERCIFSNSSIHSFILEKLCRIIQEFQVRRIFDVKEDEIQQAISMVQDFGRVRVNVQWLQKKLESILETRQEMNLVQELRKKRDESARVIKEKRKELKGYKAQKMALEEKMIAVEKRWEAALVDANEVQEIVMKVKPFIDNPLGDIL